MKKIFILSLFSLLLFSGCNDLDIAPKNLITDKDLIGSESGMIFTWHECTVICLSRILNIWQDGDSISVPG